MCSRPQNAKLWWLPELDDLEASLSGVTRCVVQNPWSSGKSWELRISSWLLSTVPGVGFIAWLFLSFSYPFQCGYFLSYLRYRSHSASFWVSEETALCVALHFVHQWQEENSWVSWVTILVTSKMTLYLSLLAESKFLVVPLNYIKVISNFTCLLYLF